MLDHNTMDKRQPGKKKIGEEMLNSLVVDFSEETDAFLGILI